MLGGGGACQFYFAGLLLQLPGLWPRACERGRGSSVSKAGASPGAHGHPPPTPSSLVGNTLMYKPREQGLGGKVKF